MMYSRDLANDYADVMTTEAEYFPSLKKIPPSRAERRCPAITTLLQYKPSNARPYCQWNGDGKMLML